MFRSLNFFHKFILGLNIIAAIALLLSYCAVFVSSRTFWLISLLGIAYIWILFINICFIFYWMLFKWRIALLAMLPVLAGFFFMKRTFATVLEHIGTNNLDNYVSIMSYNVELFKLYSWENNAQKRDSIIEFLDQQNVDIYCFQEFFYTPGNYFPTTEKLKKIEGLNYHYFEPGVISSNNHQFGVAIFSKYPIIGKGVIRFSDNASVSNLCIYTDIKLKRDTLRVYNVHFESNHLNVEEVDEIKKADDNAWQITKNWLKKLRRGYDNRREQVKKVAEHIQASPYPVVLCGDFNDVPISHTYEQIQNILEDSFVEAGFGIGTTYNGKLPGLRIDYIFKDPKIRAYNFEEVEVLLTDHFPVKCILNLSSPVEN